MGSALNPSTPKEERADMSFSRYTYCHVIKSYMIQEETETYDRGGKQSIEADLQMVQMLELVDGL
jgi:hypothetical protein